MGTDTSECRYFIDVGRRRSIRIACHLTLSPQLRLTRFILSPRNSSRDAQTIVQLDTTDYSLSWFSRVRQERDNVWVTSDIVARWAQALLMSTMLLSFLIHTPWLWHIHGRASYLHTLLYGEHTGCSRGCYWTLLVWTYRDTWLDTHGCFE